ncbi:ABC transporter substrate-binding protein [Thalassobacillus pellis]|uniref:ABC transporter substrate-binding protein n=1 Tax=Thalassobacillus pellis TaxID=748008 RepID=UPI0019606C25|nr:extracellular solute-binding protein [Thalassobacillus pellis]MBM7551492.1 raffinose/stachyose/melibiose transport system substrate-binding protein [Thalassobacillus pellis]
MLKKTKKMLLTSLVAAASAVTLVGCSSGSGDSDDAIEVFSNKSESIETYKKLIKDFEEKHPDINIELNAPPEAETVLKTRMTKGDMPEIMSIGGNATYGEIARAGMLHDFSGTEMAEKVQPAYKKMVNDLVGSEEDALYGLPYATNANAVIYNKDLMKELGLEVPQTWDQFIATLEKAKNAGITPIYFTLKDAWTGMIPWNSIAANVAGEDFAKKKNAGKASFQEDYDKVATKMLTLLEYGHKDNFGVAYGDGNKAFANGESLYYLQGNWAIPEIKKINPDINLGVFAMPVTNDPAKNELVSGVDVLLTASKKAGDNEDVMTFLKYMMEDEQAQQYIDEQKAFSALKGIYQDDPVFAGIKENFENGKLTSYPDHYYPSGMQAQNLIQEFLINKNKEEFLKNMDEEWEKVQNR